MSSFHFYRWSQFKVIPLACTFLEETLKVRVLAFLDFRST